MEILWDINHRINASQLLKVTVLMLGATTTGPNRGLCANGNCTAVE